MMMNNLNNLMMMGAEQASSLPSPFSPLNLAVVVVVAFVALLSGYFAYKFSSRFISE